MEFRRIVWIDCIGLGIFRIWMICKIVREYEIIKVVNREKG